MSESLLQDPQGGETPPPPLGCSPRAPRPASPSWRRSRTSHPGDPPREKHQLVARRDRGERAPRPARRCTETLRRPRHPPRQVSGSPIPSLQARGPVGTRWRRARKVPTSSCRRGVPASELAGPRLRPPGCPRVPGENPGGTGPGPPGTPLPPPGAAGQRGLPGPAQLPHSHPGPPARLAVPAGLRVRREHRAAAAGGGRREGAGQEAGRREGPSAGRARGGAVAGARRRLAPQSGPRPHTGARRPGVQLAALIADGERSPRPLRALPGRTRAAPRRRASSPRPPRGRPRASRAPPPWGCCAPTAGVAPASPGGSRAPPVLAPRATAAGRPRARTVPTRHCPGAARSAPQAPGGHTALPGAAPSPGVQAPHCPGAPQAAAGACGGNFLGTARGGCLRQLFRGGMCWARCLPLGARGPHVPPPRVCVAQPSAVLGPQGPRVPPWGTGSRLGATPRLRIGRSPPAFAGVWVGPERAPQ